ncbi:MAG: hypothetical protein PWR20_350 [Bacteroidales bacterium]|nr:hypothetical protein [Bacteroidales bacterium]MDN5330035.1 hypothetical protein [Bacteroidales bacterium]
MNFLFIKQNLAINERKNLNFAANTNFKNKRYDYPGKSQVHARS